ncbi:hypothetical protein YC2023_041257 [Brassica napus]
MRKNEKPQRRHRESLKRKGKPHQPQKLSKSRPPPSVSRPKPSESSKRPSSSDGAYVSPHQSPWPEGKFQIIHLGTVAYP